MNPILTTAAAVVAIAEVASRAYYYADQSGFFNRETKVEVETKVEAAENPVADIGFLLSRIPRFDGSRYEIWSSMMKTLFLSHDLWDLVEGGYTEEELTVEAVRDVQKKDATALLFIQQTINESVFSCIANANKSKEAWDALQKRYLGNTEESNQNTPMDEFVLSCAADAAKSKEARDAPAKERQGNTEESNKKKSVDDLDFSCTGNVTESKDAAWDALEQGYQDNAEGVEANRIGEEFGDLNNSCGSKKSSRGNSYCGGRNGGHFNKNQGGRGGRDGGCFNNNQGGHGGRDGGRFNSQGSHRGGDGGCFNNRGGRGGIGRGRFNNNQGGRGGINDGCFNNDKNDCGSIDGGHFNNNQGGHVGINGGCFNNKKVSKFGDYNGKSPKSESISSTTNATESKEASDALQQGHQAYTEVQVQPEAGNPSGGVNESLTSLLVGDLDLNVTDKHLYCVFSHIGQVVSASVCRDSTNQSSLGYGYVTYGNPRDAARALEVLNFTPFNGKPIRITYSRLDANIHKSGARNIFIKNLDEAIDEKALRDIFSAFGNILSCKVVTDASGQSKGYGYMEYDSEEAAQKAIEKMNGMLLNDKQVYVGPFVNKQERKMANVYVGNLSESTTEEDLRKVFGCFGTITSAVVMRDGDGKSKGFGFVNFKDVDEAAWSMEVLNGHEFDNKKWYVGRAYRKKFVGKAQKKSVDKSVLSATANATESKKAGDSVDKSVPSSTANATELKKAGDTLQKGYGGRNKVLYMDNKGIAHFKPKSL